MTLHINLLPWREIRKERQKNEFLALLGIAIVASVLLMLCIHLWIARKIHYQQENNLYLKNQIAILDEKITQIDVIEKAKKELLAKMDVIQQLQASRPEVVQLFDGIVRIVPVGLFLTSLSRNGMKVLIDGKAESNTRVSTFMRNIEGSHWLKSPELSLIQADEKEGEKNKEKDNGGDRLIGFNLQALEVSAHSAAQKSGPVSAVQGSVK